MKREFKDAGSQVGQTLNEVLERMGALGANEEECMAVSQTVEAFLRWTGRRDRRADRVAGVEWLGTIRERLEADRDEDVNAGLTTWFHLTGGARCRDTAWRGQPEPVSQGGRVSGEAASWGEAGGRLKGFLACKSDSRNTAECYLGWARRFCRWCGRSGRDLPELEAGDILGFLEWLAGTGVVAKTQNQALNALVSVFRHGIG